MENEKHNSELILLKIQHHTHFAPGKHRLPGLPSQACLQKSLLDSQFAAFSLNPVGHEAPLSQSVQNNLPGPKPGEPVCSAAMQRLHSSGDL